MPYTVTLDVLPVAMVSALFLFVSMFFVFMWFICLVMSTDPWMFGMEKEYSHQMC